MIPLTPNQMTLRSHYPLTLVEQAIHEKDFSSAAQHLVSYLLNTDLGKKELSEIKKMYGDIVRLFPYFSECKHYTDAVGRLFEYSAQCKDEQLQIALCFGEMDCKQAETKLPKQRLPAYLQAMRYYAKAISIEGKNPFSHQQASAILFKIWQEFVADDFILRLSKARGRGAILEFEQYLQNLQRAHRFCMQEEQREQLSALYQKADVLYSQIPLASQESYRPFYPLIEEGLKNTDQWITQEYRQKINAFRQVFEGSRGNISDFQEKVSADFKVLFDIFLLDAFALLGPPPCGYDVRAMGSVGRQEICPFSDVEIMILIPDEKQVEYFKTLCQVLELQITSLDETASLSLLFTCLDQPNPSGLHIDGQPATNLGFIQTPSGMAQMLQNVMTLDPWCIQHTMLKSSSLKTNDPSLFETYEKSLSSLLATDAVHQKFALDLLKFKLEDFRKEWRTPFSLGISSINLKKQYVEVLNHFLGHLALYFNVQIANTGEIIKALVGKGFFTPSSGELLKEAVDFLYDLRVLAHRHYKGQNDHVYLNPVNFDLSLFVLTEPKKLFLEKIYWLILFPLYFQLSEVIEQGETIEEMFNQCDLIKIAFEKGMISADKKTLISHIASIKLSAEEHHFYYHRLSLQKLKEDEGRRHYLEILEKTNPDLALKLSWIPNQEGVRQSSRRNSQKLQTTFSAITTSISESSKIHVKIRFANGKETYLKPEVIDHILDENGDIRSSYPASSHHVTSLVLNQPHLYNLHFKQKPTQPLMEYAIHSLTSRIAGSTTPLTELLRFEVNVQGEKKIYPVLISETIPGKTLKVVKDKIQWKNCDKSQWTGMFLCSILTRPGDGLPANFIFDPNGKIFCIDNDISFVEPVVKNPKSPELNIRFCSALFCLFSDAVLDPKAIIDFCGLDIDALLVDWIDDVIKKEEIYISLFSEEERTQLYEEDENNRFKASVLLREGTLATLNLQFWRLQHYLIEAIKQNKQLGPIDLLRYMISLREETLQNPIGAYIYSQYKQALSSQRTLEDRLKQVTLREVHKSLTTLQSDQACLGQVPLLEDVEKKKKYSPKQAREELFSILLKKSREGLISHGKLPKGRNFIQASFKTIPDEDRQISVLQSLASFVTHEPVKPSSVILQHCYVLDTHRLKPFLHPNLLYLDLSFCSKLKDSDLVLIQQTCPHLKELYLNGCQRLKQIDKLNFYSKPLKFQELTIFYLSHCEKLTSVKCHIPSLKVLSLNSNPQLTTVEIKVDAYPELDFTGCPKLDIVKTKTNMIKNAFNLLHPALIPHFILLYDNNCTTLDLRALQLRDKDITDLSCVLKKNISLQNLNISKNLIGDNGISALSEALKNHPALTKLDLSENQIGDFGAQALEEMLKTNTSLKEIHLKNNPSLKNLDPKKNLVLDKESKWIRTTFEQEPQIEIAEEILRPSSTAKMKVNLETAIAAAHQVEVNTIFLAPKENPFIEYEQLPVKDHSEIKLNDREAHVQSLYHHLLNTSHLGGAKASGFDDLSEGSMHSIQPSDKSSNRESFRASQNVKYSIDGGITFDTVQTPNKISSLENINSLQPLIREKLQNPQKELSLEDSITLLTQCIQYGKAQAQKAHNKDAVIFIGNTGSGKSTTINYLCGCTMDQELGGLEKIVVVRPPSAGGLLEEVMPIGHTKESKTFIPQIETDVGQGITYCDCPGFLDNRGAEINIANAVNIKSTIRQAKSVKVIILINYHSLQADRARGLSEMLKISCNLFGQADNLIEHKESILVGITNIPLDMELDRLKKWMITDNTNSVMTTLCERLFIFDPLERSLNGGVSRDQLLAQIKCLTPITTQAKVFTTVLTDEDENKLIRISEQIGDRIHQAIKSKNFSRASAEFQNLQLLSIIEHITIERLISNNRGRIERQFQDDISEFKVQCHFERFEKARELLNILQQAMSYFDQELQKTVKIEELIEYYKVSAQKYIQAQQKEKEYQEQLGKAQQQIKEFIAILEQQKRNTEELLHEQQKNFKQAIQEMEGKMQRTASDYEKMKGALAREMEERLAKKAEELKISQGQNLQEAEKKLQEEKNKLQAEHQQQLKKIEQEYNQTIQEQQAVRSTRETALKAEQDQLRRKLEELEKTKGEKLQQQRLQEIKKVPQVEPKRNAVPSMAFGKSKWEEYIGTVGAEPPLPADIDKILKGPCPFWEGKRVEETHMLVLKVTAVNGKALSLDSLGELVHKPKKGNATKYDSFNTGQYKSNTPADASYWMLMTRDVIPESRNKTFNDQEKLLATYSQKAGAAYEVPSVLDASVCIFMEYVQSGTVLYSEKSWTFTRCREKYNADYQLIVGGFAPGGLRVLYDCVYYDRPGLGALRKVSLGLGT